MRDFFFASIHFTELKLEVRKIDTYSTVKRISGQIESTSKALGLAKGCNKLLKYCSIHPNKVFSIIQTIDASETENANQALM